jgi:putative transposase
MRKSRFTEEHIVGVLKEAAAGLKVETVCRKHGISEHTFYRWKAKYGGLEVSEARRLKIVEDENRRLKTLVADLTLDNQMLRRSWRESGDPCCTPSGGGVAPRRVRREPAPIVPRARRRAFDDAVRLTPSG